MNSRNEQEALQSLHRYLCSSSLAACRMLTHCSLFSEMLAAHERTNVAETSLAEKGQLRARLAIKFRLGQEQLLADALARIVDLQQSLARGD